MIAGLHDQSSFQSYFIKSTLSVSTPLSFTGKKKKRKLLEEKKLQERIMKTFLSLVCLLFCSAQMYCEEKDTFLYFAYGSNLLKKRIRINNPTAEFLGPGKLEGHVLDFIKWSPNWRGASATIVPTENTGAHVWGAIWRIHNKDMPALDKQEGLDTNWYFAKNVTVITPENDKVLCRTYQQTINPDPLKEGETLPMERRPCITYMDVIVKGAIECGLPADYIEKLKEIPNNGQEAPPEMIEKLKKM